MEIYFNISFSHKIILFHTSVLSLSLKYVRILSSPFPLRKHIPSYFHLPFSHKKTLLIASLFLSSKAYSHILWYTHLSRNYSPLYSYISNKHTSYFSLPFSHKKHVLIVSLPLLSTRTYSLTLSYPLLSRKHSSSRSHILFCHKDAVLPLTTLLCGR